MQIDHNAYPLRLKEKTTSQLLFIITDCQEALKANPDTPKAGYYQDEINYASMELGRRREQLLSRLSPPSAG